ncbi:MAG: hypothetical protein IPJ84_09685 [Bdellovibrionales bacterium]|nr:hypothetical protein [Bdellovibrionales bacterium]
MTTTGLTFRLLVTGALLLTASNAFALNRGGMSGGGGNVMNPTPPDRLVNRHEVRALANRLPTLLPKVAHYLAQKQSSLAQIPVGQAGADENLRPLFQTRYSILRLLKTVPLDVEHHKSCFDGSGNPVDGSVAEDDDEVCLSALNIALKVHPTEIDAQSQALIVHEYGEKAGLDEAAAISVQAQVLEDVLNTP